MLGMAAMCRWLTHPYRVAKGLSGRFCAHEVHSHSWQATDLESTTTMLLQAIEFTTKKPGLCSYVEVRLRPPMTSDTFSASDRFTALPLRHMPMCEALHVGFLCGSAKNSRFRPVPWLRLDDAPKLLQLPPAVRLRCAPEPPHTQKDGARKQPYTDRAACLN